MKRVLAGIVLVLALLAAAGTAFGEPPQPTTPPPSPAPSASATPTPPSAAPSPSPSATPTAPTASPSPSPASPSSSPTDNTAPEVPPPPGEPSVSRSSGLIDSLCQRADKARTPECRTAGVVFRSHDLSHYGLDAVDTQSFETLKDNIFDGILQEIIVRVWSGMVWLLNAALMLLQWGFMLDPVNDSMQGVGRALDRLHNDVLGEPWFLAALSILGLWGIWNGLVRMKAIETIGGMLMAVVLMVLALWIIHDPKDTVGQAAYMGNQAAMSVLSASTEGTVAKPVEGLSSTTSGLFDTIVLQPWCALQFGDVQYCLAEKNGRSTADLWLAYPARSAERHKLYAEVTKDDSWWGKVKKAIASGPSPPWGQLPDDVKGAVQKDPEKMALLEPPGSTSRLGLAVLILPGMFAAFLLIGWLGLKQIQAGFWALVLLVFFPVFLFAPAFGEAGRKVFLEALVRLFSAVLFVLLCAIYLSAVVVVSTEIGRLAGPDLWMHKWLLQSGFFVMVFLKRNELLGFLSMGALKPDAGRLPGLLTAYAGWRLLADASRLVAAGPRAAIHGARRHQAFREARGADRDEADLDATRQTADETLHRIADDTLRTHAEREYSQRHGARDTMAQGERSKRRIAAIDEELRRGKSDRAPAGWREDLQDERRRHEEFLASDRYANAKRTTGQSGLGKDRVEPTRTEREAWLDARRRHLDANLPPDDDAMLRDIGSDRASYDAATPEQRRLLRLHSERAIERDRALFRATPPGGATPNREDVRDVRRPGATHLDERELGAYREEHYRRLREARVRGAARERARHAARERLR